MLLLNKPSEKTIQQFIKEQKSVTLSYAEVGASKDGVCPSGYGKDRVRQKLGSGEEVFAQAVAAFEKWKQFEVGWVDVYPNDAPLILDSTIAILAFHKSFWSLNACRIVYTINEQGPINKFGFGYGTLLDHSETGEERFLLEWDKNSDIVTYDILAFSNPNSLLGWLGYPLVRFIQNKFRRDSERLMRQKMSDVVKYNQNANTDSF